MPCYLFVHFVGEKDADGEQIYFSVSRDGLHWQDLNAGQPVLRSSIGTRGVRDPFMVRHPVTGRYYLMATDLSIFHRPDWKLAERQGSRSLIVWESENLTHWSAPRACPVGTADAGCVWAPEAIWDAERNAFMVFFASMVQKDGEQKPKQRMYAVYTQDFITFTGAVLYAEAENHLIDTTIVQEDGWYYRFTKDESTKKIVMERMRGLHDVPQRVESPLLAALPGMEGPECYPLPDGRWCLMLDQFAAKKGYLPLVADRLSDGDFRIVPGEAYDLGQTCKRHGGILAITEKEMAQLLHAYAP